MHRSMSAILATILCAGLALLGPATSHAMAQSLAKAQVANLITRVENGVDEFRDYLEKRGENASDVKSTACQGTHNDSTPSANLEAVSAIY